LGWADGLVDTGGLGLSAAAIEKHPANKNEAINEPAGRWDERKITALRLSKLTAKGEHIRCSFSLG
jgi:hypothetical protein